MAGKAGIILSLLGKLDDVAEKTAGKKVSKAKKGQIDAERVQEALNEKLAENPQYLEELSDKDYKSLMNALPAKSQADVMGDDYSMGMYEQQAEAAGGMSGKEAAENLSLFHGAEDVYSYLQKLKPQDLKEFKANVSEEDVDMYGPALDRLEKLTPRAAKMKGGTMKNDPMKVKYAEGGRLSVSEYVTARDKALKDMDNAESIAAREKISKDFSKVSKKFMEQESLGDSLDKERKEKAEALKKKNMGGMMKYNKGGSMLVPPEMEMEDDVPVDTYSNIPEEDMEEVKASQLPDDEMEQEHLQYVLNEALPVEDQEYLMELLDTDERLSDIFDKVVSIATEFSGSGEVEGPGTGTSDSIPARLSYGEFVFTKKATDQLGADQLQTMMDEAEKAYDGGLMKKAFGGMVDDAPTDNRGGMYSETGEEEEIKKQMISANQMPSVR